MICETPPKQSDTPTNKTDRCEREFQSSVPRSLKTQAQDQSQSDGGRFRDFLPIEGSPLTLRGHLKKDPDNGSWIAWSWDFHGDALRSIPPQIAGPHLP